MLHISENVLTVLLELRLLLLLHGSQKSKLRQRKVILQNVQPIHFTEVAVLARLTNQTFFTAHPEYDQSTNQTCKETKTKN